MNTERREPTPAKHEPFDETFKAAVDWVKEKYSSAKDRKPEQGEKRLSLS